MRVIINGSRSFSDPKRFLLLPDEDPSMKDFLIRERLVQWVDDAVRLSKFEVTTVISGDCRGIDKAAESWATRQGIPVELYPADWSKGKSAGFARNLQMLSEADALVSVYDGASSGTSHLIVAAKNKWLGSHVYTHYIRGFINNVE